MRKFRDGKPLEVVVHHSASMHGNVEEVRRWHLARGFDDIGYHFVITREGAIEKGRSLEYEGAHTRSRGKNRTSIGICVIGDSTKEPFTQNQFTALFNLVNSLRWIYRIDFPVSQHSDHDPRRKPHCAGFTTQQLGALS
jgi:N-acetylmuramoyl-L-alanine amidase